MDKPRVFLGSSGKQAKLVQALTRGLEDIAVVEPWTTSFNPGTTTLGRLMELSHEVDFAVFVFAEDDWTTNPSRTSDAAGPGQASPRDNVVFEAGLFGSVIGMKRTFILHSRAAKLPSDLLGLTLVRYDVARTPAEMRAINQKLRKAIEDEGRMAGIEGDWWQYSLTARSEREPSAISLVRVVRDQDGALSVNGRGWQEDGRLSVRYWSEATKQRTAPSGVFYYWNGERPRDPNAPQLHGTGEILIESVDRAAGYWTTRSDADPNLKERTSGVDWRAQRDDMGVLDSGDDRQRARLIAQRVKQWKALTDL
jgi:predicted nucleotide-binding protein with TIR-like domain